MKIVKVAHALLLLLSCTLWVSCGSQEKLIPLYKTKNIVKDMQSVKFHIDVDIPATTVEESIIRKWTRVLVGWIPGVGVLAEGTMNFVGDIIPALPSISHENLPPDSQLNDPKVLEALSAIRLKTGSIRIVPAAERKNFECSAWYRFWDGFKCPEVHLKEMLSSVDVYLTAKDKKADYKKTNSSGSSTPEDPNDSEKEVLLAWATIQDDYDAANETLKFNTAYNVNLKDYLERYGNFDIRIEARGWYPNFNTQIDGKVSIELELPLSGESTAPTETLDELSVN